MKKTKTLSVLILYIFFNVLLYAGIAFVKMEFDPVKWHEENRMIFVTFGGICGFVLSLAPYVLNFDLFDYKLKDKPTDKY